MDFMKQCIESLSMSLEEIFSSDSNSPRAVSRI